MPSSFAEAMTEAIKRRQASQEKVDDAERKRAAEEAQKRLGYGKGLGG